MTNQVLKRRPHAYVGVSPEHLPYESSLNSPYQSPFGYSTLPPSSSFPTGQSRAFSTSVSVSSVSQAAFAFGEECQQDARVFESQPTYYHHQQFISEHGNQTHHPEHPNKRLRLDSASVNPDMPLSSLSWGFNSCLNDDRSPVSAYNDEDTGNATSAFPIFQSLGNCLAQCNTESSGISTGYQPVLSMPSFGPRNSQAYSSDQPAPSRSVAPQFTCVGSPIDEKADYLIFSDTGHLLSFQDQHTIILPENYTIKQSMPQEVMQYQPIATHDTAHRREISPPLVKAENPRDIIEPNHPQTFPTVAPAPASQVVHPVAGQILAHPWIPHVTEAYQPAPQLFMPPPGLINQDTIRHEPFDYEPLASQDTDSLTVVLTDQKPPVTRRGPFTDLEKRKKTAETRKIGSCIRCRMQRIRCEFPANGLEDENAPCDKCLKIGTSPKIHRIACKRWKIIDVKLSKPGQVEGYPQLAWTHRWKDSSSLPEINQWESSEERVIHVSDGFWKSGIPVTVRRFKWMQGDKTRRTWYNRVTGDEEWKEIPLWAVVDVADLKKKYENYTADPANQERIFMELVKSSSRSPDQSSGALLWKTYRLAQMRRMDPAVPLGERDLLAKTMQLWVSIRLTTKSFDIVGDENLDIPDIEGKFLLPPVMGGQIDKVLLDHILLNLRRTTLDTLQTVTQKKKRETWITTYLVSFILLHNVALITKHDLEYSEKHNLGRLWTRPEMVEQYHLGANILLAYFHYCNKNVYPFSDNCKDSDLATLAQLDEPAVEYVRDVRTYINGAKDRWENLRLQGYTPSTDPHADAEHAEAYSNETFFVSMLYQQNWVPQDSIINKEAERRMGPSRPRGRFASPPSAAKP